MQFVLRESRSMRLFLLLFLSITLHVQAQQGGLHAFSSLQLVSSPRVAALGGELISSAQEELDFAFRNPALFRSDMLGDFSMNWTFYYAGVKFGSTRYAFDTKRLGTIAMGLHFVNYGKMELADASGQILGEFSAADYVLQGIYSKQVSEHTYVGVMPQLAYSYIESYTSMAIALNAGLYHYWEEKDAEVSVVVKQLGTQLFAYHEQREPIPFQIHAGISKKLEYAPFRWHITLQNLQRPDLSYDDPNLYSNDPITGEVIKDNVSIGDKVLRHFIFGLELFPDANFSMQLGYNHRRKQEMKRELVGRTVGWSFGTQIKFRRFHLQYARARYHLAGSTNQLGIRMNFKNF